LHITASHRDAGDLVRLAAVPQALVEGDPVGIVDRCREGGPVEHGAGPVSTAPDVPGSLKLSAVRDEGGDTDPGRNLPVGQGPQFAHRGQDRAMSAAAVIRPTPPEHAENRCANRKGPAQALRRIDDGLDRGLQSVDRRVQRGEQRLDRPMDGCVERPLRLFCAEVSLRSARFGTRASRIIRSALGSGKASPKATRMRASTRSVLARCPVARAKSRQSHALRLRAQTTGSAELENHPCKAPVASGQKQRPRPD